MSTPQSEIDKLLNQAKAIECRVDKYPIFYDSLAFSAAMAIVQYEDPALLDKLPSWIGEKVHEMRDIYLEQKSYIIYSSVGMADHSEMMRKLSELLPQRNAKT